MKSAPKGQVQTLCQIQPCLAQLPYSEAVSQSARGPPCAHAPLRRHRSTGLTFFRSIASHLELFAVLSILSGVGGCVGGGGNLEPKQTGSKTMAVWPLQNWNQSGVGRWRHKRDGREGTICLAAYTVLPTHEAIDAVVGGRNVAATAR